MWLDRTCQGLGTRIRLVFERDTGHRTVWQTCLNRLRDLELVFSAHLPQSELCRLNQAAGSAPVQLSAELFELIAVGKRASLAPDSQLNIALGPVIQAWHIGFADARQPSQQELDHLLPLCRPDWIELDESKKSVLLPLPGMALDLGALAKGYIADRLLDLLKDWGVKSALIDLGGNILTYGQPPSGQKNWLVGIQKPFASRGQAVGQLPLTNQALVTSGVYERVLTTDKGSYHHILNPKTGYPMATEMTSLSVLAPNALTADLWSSRLFGLAPHDALDWLNRSPDLEGLVLTRDRRLLLSDGLKKQFSVRYH